MPAEREDLNFSDAPSVNGPDIDMRNLLQDHADLWSERDHMNMDTFIDAVLQDHKDGVITMAQARGAMVHVMTALATGNVGEAQDWFHQGRKLIRRVN